MRLIWSDLRDWEGSEELRSQLTLSETRTSAKLLRRQSARPVLSARAGSKTVCIGIGGRSYSVSHDGGLGGRIGQPRLRARPLYLHNRAAM